MTGGKKPPSRSEVRSEIDELRRETGGDPDGPPSVTIEHVQVELPDDEKVAPDDPGDPGGPRADTGESTAEVRGVTRRIDAERDDKGEWVGGTTFADDDAVDLPERDDDGDGGGKVVTPPR